MRKILTKVGLLKKMSEEQIQKWAEELVSIVRNSVEKRPVYVEQFVNQLRRQNPYTTNQELVEKIIFRKSLKAGAMGAMTNSGGGLTLPFTIPTEMYHCFRIQSDMVMAIPYVYGWNIRDPDMSTDILLVMGGEAGINALKEAGVKVGQELAKKAVDRFITREVIKKINRIVSRKIITKAGEKSLMSFVKLVPCVGAPIGAAIDHLGTRAVGKLALKFYRT